jgi:salicylate hydroxylase
MVCTSDAAGRMYCFTDPECGSDLVKIVANARGRFTWIWDHDLRADVARAEEEFRWLAERSQVPGSG